MRKSRMVTPALAAAALLTLSLVGAVGASARDGHGRDDGAQHAQGHGHEQEAARHGDRGHDGDDDGGRALLRSTLAPSLPTDPALAGVAPGGLPWVLGRGGVVLRADGRIRVTLRGLVIPVAHGTLPAGTALPVTTVSASLVCADPAATRTTHAVAISSGGDATIDDTIALPASCLAPAVLVNPNGDATHFIAATGWR